VIDLLLASTFLLALAAVAAKCMGRASAAQRHAVWMFGFLAIPLAVLLPIAAGAAHANDSGNRRKSGAGQPGTLRFR
jgi:hypothetical protein